MNNIIKIIKFRFYQFFINTNKIKIIHKFILPYTIYMTEYINGPTNFAHLQGSIDSIDKNIYFFMDSHYDLDNQTRCESFNSIDISQYLYKIIKETKQPLDFFMEICSTNIDTVITNKKDIYIKDVISLFKTEFIIKKEDNIDVMCSKNNKNVRLHYLDIRDHLELFDVLNIIDDDMKINVELLINNFNNNEKDTYMQNILNNIESIKKKIKIIKHNKKIVLQNKLNNYNKTTESQKYYLNKVINKYEDNDLKKNINEFINNYYDTVIYSLYKEFGKLEGYMEKNNTIDEKMLYALIESIIGKITDLYSLFTDAFLLRRILDKKYVKKAIVYSGRQHSLNCIFFLVKYYDFKIIKIYDSSEKDVNKLTEQIYNADNVFKTYKLFNVDEKNIQCIYYETIHDGGNRILYD